jgi:creatinine amidohydrolase
MAVLEDVIDSLEGVGVPKLVLLNGHGGNDFKQMLRELQARHEGIFLSCVSWFQIDDGKDLFDQPGDHADERETSLMLHLRPDLVRAREEWGDGDVHPWKLEAMKARWAWAQRAWTRATVDTGSGSPHPATAEKGRDYMDLLGGQLAGFLTELAAADVNALYEGEG